MNKMFLTVVSVSLKSGSINGLSENLRSGGRKE